MKLNTIVGRAWRQARTNSELRSAYAFLKPTLLVGKHLLGGAPPVLVYQMGSVGSKSISRSLRKGGYSGLVHHAHDLRDGSRSSREEAIYRFCIDGPIEIKVISLVRDPIARNVSAFFQDFEKWTGVLHEKYKGDTEELIDKFIKHYDHESPLQWFDQWEETLGIDIYNYPFPERGYNFISKGAMQVLTLRTELPDDVKEKAIRKFLSVGNFDLERRNDGAGKPYAEKYAQFKQSFTAPDSYITKMYESEFFRHFYTDKHRNQFENRWSA
jgi:hypothetical protein